MQEPKEPQTKSKGIPKIRIKDGDSMMTLHLDSATNRAEPVTSRQSLMEVLNKL